MIDCVNKSYTFAIKMLRNTFSIKRNKKKKSNKRYV